MAKAELQVAQTTAAAATASAEKAATDAQAHSDALGETCGDVQPFSCLLKEWMSGLELSRCSGKQTAEEVKAQQERLEEAHTAALEMMIAQHEEQKNELQITLQKQHEATVATAHTAHEGER